MSLVLSTKEDAQLSRLLLHVEAVRDNWESVCQIKEAIRKDDIGMFLAEWNYLGKDLEERRAIHTALIRTEGAGGVWFIPEYKKLREWGA